MTVEARNRRLSDPVITAAPEIGRIGAVTDHVLDLALARCRRWLDQDIALSVAVNLSAHCLTEPDLVARIRRALRRHRVPGQLLTLELTEGSVVDDSVRDSSVLGDLHALGLRLSMDDFGTGYSSLAYLRQLPLDTIKVDRSFVTDLDVKDPNIGIIRAVVSLAHGLGITVVADAVVTVGGGATTDMGGFLAARLIGARYLGHVSSILFL